MYPLRKPASVPPVHDRAGAVPRIAEVDQTVEFLIQPKKEFPWVAHRRYAVDDPLTAVLQERVVGEAEHA